MVAQINAGILIFSINQLFFARVTNFGEDENKICHNSACIKCISKVSIKQAVLGVARWHLGLHFSMVVLDVMVTNLENIIVFVSSATDLLLIF